MGGYVKSEEHFVNLVCKRVRELGIAFKNHDEFVESLRKIYYLSEDIKPLTQGSRLIDVITWILYRVITSKEELLRFLNEELKEIISEAIDIYNQSTDREFKYLQPIRKPQIFKFENTIFDKMIKRLSRKAIDELSKLENCYGIYFLYNDKDQLIYIGKSHNLADRIISSARERHAKKFAYILAKNPADIHILEPYLIIKYKPIKNSEFMEYGDTSFEIDVPPISEIIPLYEEEEYKIKTRR